MDKTKPQIDQIISFVTLQLKPWKGKVSNLVIPCDSQKDLPQQAINRAKELKAFKRRTITGIVIPVNVRL